VTALAPRFANPAICLITDRQRLLAAVRGTTDWREALHEQLRGAVAGGIDVSLPVSIGVAAVLYLGSLFLFPEPRYVFGPRGPWLVPCRDLDDALPGIRSKDGSAVHRADGVDPAAAAAEPVR